MLLRICDMKKSNPWKFLADLNISIKTVQFLQSLGIDIKRVDKTVLTDNEVVDIAQKEEQFSHLTKILELFIIFIRTNPSPSLSCR